jgi:hypothetical protein
MEKREIRSLPVDRHGEGFLYDVFMATLGMKNTIGKGASTLLFSVKKEGMNIFFNPRGKEWLISCERSGTHRSV